MILYNTNFTHNPNSYLTLAVERAARAVWGAENVVTADNRSLATLAASGEHEILLCLDGQRLNRPLIERVRPAFKAVALWLFEDPFMLDYNQSNAALFDLVLTNDPACAAAYGGKGHYLPLAASQSLHHRPVLDDAALEYDVFFAGTMWPNRVQTIRRLLTAFPGKRFKLVCPTNIYLPPLPRDIAARAIQWPINHESFIDFANSSRVTLTMFRDYASHGTVGQASAPGPRLFELGLAGTAQVVEIDPGMDPKPFDIIAGVACRNQLPALVTEIESLLRNPALRAERAAAAQHATANGHLYEDRLRRVAALTGASFARRPAPPLPAPARPAVAQNRRMRVLMCTHSTIRSPEWGGVEVYQQVLITALANTVEVFFWLRRGRACSLTAADGTPLEQFEVNEVGWLDSLTDAAEETAFANVISQYEIDIVHFQHLGHHTASLPIIAKSSGAGTLISAHDFFLVCSRYNLLDYSSTFCDIGNRSITACDICLRIAEGVPAGGQEVRRTFIAEMLRSVDVVLFGTRHSEELCQRIYPRLAQQRRAVLGIPTPQDVAAAPPPRPLRDREQPLKVAVLGNFLRSKGADTVIAVIESVDPALFEFHVIGKAEPQYEAVFNGWNRPNVVYHGRYNTGEFATLAACDVSLHLSIWPETFCISLSEAWQRGLVPIVTALGGLRDRVTHGENGFVVRVSDAAAVIGHLEYLRADPATLAAMQGNITPELWGSIAAHAAAVHEIYRSLMPRAKLGAAPLTLDAGQVHLLPHATWRDLAPPRHIFDPPRRSDLSLDPPLGITAWAESRDVLCRIDGLAGNPFEAIEDGLFQPSDRIAVNGWSFVPGLGTSGQVHVALINRAGDSAIYLKATRLRRDEVAAAFPGAPAQCGFTAEAAVHGKWSDGQYRVALINVINDRARFNLTELVLTLRDGRAAAAAISPNTPAETLGCFRQVAGPAAPAPTPPPTAPASPAPALPAILAGLTVLDQQTVRYNFDRVGNLPRLAPGGTAIPPTATLTLRGWCVQARELHDAGDLYVGLIAANPQIPAQISPRSPAPPPPLVCKARRDARPDIKLALNNLVPESSGFTADLQAPADAGPAPQEWRIFLCNIVAGEAVIEVTNLSVQAAAARFVQVTLHDTPGDPTPLLARIRTALSPTPGAPTPGDPIPDGATTRRRKPARARTLSR